MAAISESLTPELLDQLKYRTATTLFDIVSTNRITTYFGESPLLSRFRDQFHVDDLLVASQDEAIRKDQLFKIFTSAVPLSEYPDYLPFVSRLFESPCRVSRITNLLAPGVPLYIVHSSGTIGAAAKTLPRCRWQKWSASTGDDGEATCMLFSARYVQVVDVWDDDGETVLKRIPVCLSSSRAIRGHQGFDVDADESLMRKKVPPNNTSPFAVTLIQDYRTYLLMHGFFALADPKLAVISTTFSTLFHDFVRTLKGNWDILVQAIEDGKLPDLDGLESSRQYLQELLAPDPIRAAELRSIITGTEGWLRSVWPNLRLVSAAVGGPLSIMIPKIRYHLGPHVVLASAAHGSTEAMVATGYSEEYLDWLRVSDQDHIEFLEIENQGLIQLWELQPGKNYEPVVTTKNGLWRYRLGDVVQAIGFDPGDGQPIIRYVGRRNMSIRIADALITEQNLTDAIHSLKDTIGDITEFTTFVDDRNIPSSCGYFVELDNPGVHLKAAGTPALLHARLSRDNGPYKLNSAIGRIGIPSIYILRPGTFRQYREWKIKAAGSGNGQIKVPSVVPNNEVMEWFKQNVAYEI